MNIFDKVEVKSYGDLIKVLRDNLSIAYILVVIISIILEALYYKKFKIDIFSYLELSEYLVYFFKSFYEYLISIFISYFSCLIIFNLIDIIRFTGKLYHISIIKFRIISYIISFLFSIYLLELFIIPIYSWSGIFLSFLLWNSYHSYKSYSDKQFGFSQYDIPFFIFLFFSGALISSYYNHEKTLNESQNIEIIFSNEKFLKIDTNLKLIGVTNNYIFIHNKIENRTIVYKRDNIIKMVYK